MTPWLEETYANYEEGYVSYRIRVWGLGKHGKKIKKTVKTFKITIRAPYFSYCEISDGLVCYHFFTVTVEGMDGKGVFTQITINDNTENKKSIWLSQFPEHIKEYFEGEVQKDEKVFIGFGKC